MTKQEKRQQQRREARALLEGFWPDVFSFNKPKPLAVGILAEMTQDAEARGLPFGFDILKEAVKQYTLRHGYQFALVKCAERYDLRGEVAGAVTDEQKVRARAELKHRQTKNRRKQASVAAEGAKPEAMQPDA